MNEQATTLRERRLTAAENHDHIAAGAYLLAGALAAERITPDEFWRLCEKFHEREAIAGEYDPARGASVAYRELLQVLTQGQSEVTHVE